MSCALNNAKLSRFTTGLHDQRFRKGVGGRGLATNNAQHTAKIVSQNGVLLLIRAHRKKRTEKRLEFMVWEGFPCANPHPSANPFSKLLT